MHDLLVSVLNAAHVSAETILVELLMGCGIPEAAGIRGDLVSKNDLTVVAAELDLEVDEVDVELLEEAEHELIYLESCSEGLEGLRLAPCRTITSEGVVPVFSAEVLINEKPADVLVGVTREPISGADCIFDPNIII